MELTIRKLLPRLRGFSSSSVRCLESFAFCRRASVALEGVAYIAFTVVIAATALEIVKTMQTGDILERAAQAVARDHVLQQHQARNSQELQARAWEAIRAEVGDDGLDSNLVDVKFEVYLDPTKMLNGTLSTDDYSQVGGGPGDMVVVKLSYQPTTGFAWLRRQLSDNGQNGDVKFVSLAVTRNELALATNPDEPATTAQTEASDPNLQTDDPNNGGTNDPNSPSNDPLQTNQLDAGTNNEPTDLQGNRLPR